MTLFDRVFKGSEEMYELAVAAVEEALGKYDAHYGISLPNTAYGLPCLYAFTGTKVKTLGELRHSLEIIRGMMRKEKRTGDIFSSGIATALSAEVIETVRCLLEEDYPGAYHGHLSDAEIRELGVPLVTGDMPGAAVIIGPAPTDEQGAKLIKDYQSKGLIVFLVGGIIDQAVRMNVNMGFKIRIVPLGQELPSVVHAVSVTLRAAMIFGNIKPGDYDAMCKYTFERMFAFVNAFGPLSNMTVACGAGAIALGFPVVTDDSHNVWSVPKSLLIQKDIEKFSPTSLEARNIKIKITEIPIPVSFATAFEGEIVRRNNMQVEADGSRTDCFELVRTREPGEIQDHDITLVGPDFDQAEAGARISLGILVDVAGKGMHSDFEPVVERRFHNFFNCIEGVMHTGQRDMIRLRVSKDAFEAGFRAKHLGEVLYAKIKSEYSAVIDKCAVTIITDPEKVADFRKQEAAVAYDKRDARLNSLTDESVDVFYSCILCQSFSPSHVCIVTPERLGLCGAVSWLDAKATNELDPNGPCQVVGKNGLIDERLGCWDDVNAAVQKLSQGALERVTLYSIMEDPMTSCGCFECICGIEPFSNGVVIVNREYAGMTPLGMTFAELASMTGGGVQTPGFMGHGKHFIGSKKFLKAEGGIGRIVWMPKHLKDSVAARLNATALEMYGIENFCDRIGDETIAEDPDSLLAFLNENGHPVLEMEPMM